MLPFLILLGVIAVVAMLGIIDFLSLRWGADSRDGMNSPEWERRSLWYLRARHHES